ncbi:MBL fold metallo-hydrolase [Anoxybacterium hadale]|uniref:MBL fold metallo-hydrolase n=1 Tax=Anoxybacterium hadale TaxID=3408580 RepID=A0ACD1A9Z0_9FIRM|nr:MBL fold metallo-hydrolase [Clostridiales bacterium]
MRIQILSENRTNHTECMAEHGLAVYIETDEKTLVFDMGGSQLYLDNADKLKIDLTQADAAVISHGHYDHTGGIPSFCKLNKNAPIYIHKEAFGATYGMEDGKLDEESCGIRWTEEEKKMLQGRLILTEGPLWLTNDIVISGTIPKTDVFTPTEQFYIKGQDGELRPDEMNHEQFLAIRLKGDRETGRGIFIFSGCSHTGVIPCISYAKELFPGEKILGLLAGMHLYHTKGDDLNQILDQIAAEEMEYVIPVHCTGMEGICGLKLRLGSRCIPAGVGDQLIF